MWLHLLLFALTGVTTTLAGVGWANEIPPDVNGLGLGWLADLLGGLFFLRELAFIGEEPTRLLSGFTFSVPLLAILLTHEMGHYLTARRYGVDASLPFFIPVPTALGTLGAVIGMRSPSKDRGALLDIGASGPLVGFVVAFAVLLIGFSTSEVKDAAALAAMADQGALAIEGDSVVYALARWLVHGSLPPGADIVMSGTAAAGWFGMYLTWLNLLPFSQFDGGHVISALTSRHSRAFSLGVVAALLALFVITWNPFWAVLPAVLLLFSRFIGLTHPPVEDTRPLTPRRKLTAFVAMLVFLGTFVPNPWHPAPTPEAPATTIADEPADVEVMISEEVQR